MHTTLGRRRLAGVAIAATAALAAWAPTAPAEEPPAAATAPVPCDENVIADPAGDAFYYMTPVAFNTEPDKQAGPPNLDVRKVFFTYTPAADGKKQLRANLVIEKLDKTLPDVPWADTVFYEVSWETEDGVLNIARASHSGGDYSYEFEVFTPLPEIGGLRTSEAEDTTGRVVEGPNGVVSIDIPEGAVPEIAVGTPLPAVSATSYFNAQSTFTAPSDEAPDEGDPPTIPVPDCKPAVAKSETPTDLPKDEVKTETKTEAPAPPAPPAPAAEAAVAPAPAPFAAPAKPVVKKKATSKAKKCKAKKGKGRKARAKTCKAAKKTKARSRKRSR